VVPLERPGPSDSTDSAVAKVSLARPETLEPPDCLDLPEPWEQLERLELEVCREKLAFQEELVSRDLREREVYGTVLSDFCSISNLAVVVIVFFPIFLI